MGAATCILHGDRDPSIAGMVLDSPFTSLKDLAEELVDVFVGVRLPKWMVSIALNMVRSTIKSKARFDINDITPISHADKTFIPGLFVAAKGDTFIHPGHARKIHDAYAGDRNLVLVDGDHNSSRPRFFLDSVAIFFYNTLQCEDLPKQPARPEDVTAFFPPVPQMEPQRAAHQSAPIAMRPPDRGEHVWDEYSNEDVMIQQAIQESLRHVSEEDTPAEVVEREKTASNNLDFI
jgi:hypothetical protein